MRGRDAESARGPASERWVCPRTHRTLEATDGGLATAGGETFYEVVDGVPIFADGEEDRRRAERREPLLEELERRIEASSSEEAAAWFCERRRCAREPYAGDWKCLFAPPPDGPVLELGAGFGDDTFLLPGDPFRVAALVPTLQNARIVARRLREARPGPWSVVVLPSAERLPFADRSVAAIAVEEAALAGFGIDETSFRRVAAEWRRVLRADGSIFLGLGNPLHRLPGVGALRARLAPEPPDSMNRAIKRSAAPGHEAALTRRTVLREMRRRGFADPEVYAPLPSEKKADAVIPVRDRVATAYFLERLVRRNSPAVRAALLLARLASRRNAFACLVPYHYHFFRLAPSSPGVESAP